MKILPERIEAYAERFFQRSGRTEFPEVRRVAKRFRVPQAAVEQAVEDHDNLMLTSWNTEVPEPLGFHFVEVVDDPKEEVP